MSTRWRQNTTLPKAGSKARGQPLEQSRIRAWGTVPFRFIHKTKSGYTFPSRFTLRSLRSGNSGFSLSKWQNGRGLKLFSLMARKVRETYLLHKSQQVKLTASKTWVHQLVNWLIDCNLLLPLSLPRTLWVQAGRCLPYTRGLRARP